MKRLLAALLAMALMLGLTGCGSQAQDESSLPSQSSSEAAVSSNAPEESEESQTSSTEEDVVTITNVVDGVEYTVEFPEAPSRAVSLAGFTTEMMLALGLEDRMVGTAYQDNEILPEFKEAYESIEILSDRNPSQEVLLNASPDFITGWASAMSEKNFPIDFLEKNNIRYFIPRSEGVGAGIDEVYEDFRQLGEIFRVEDKAEEVIADMQEKIGAVEEKVKDLEPVKVFVYDSGEDAPYTAGASLPSDLIRLAGGENVFENDGDYWITVQWEAVVEKNPDWIVVMQYDASDDVQGKIDVLKNHPALQNIDAVKNDRIMVLGLSDVLAGVRNITAVETMAENFHPEAFE